MNENRGVELERTTKETKVRVSLSVDGQGRAKVQTGIGFLDHLWESFAKHGAFDLDLYCEGDLHVDDHHTSEDCALLVGQAFDKALRDRAGIHRFGVAYVPMDETLVRAVVDLSGRPHWESELRFSRPSIGTLATENISHAMRSLANAAKSTLHVDLLRGSNDHHRAEAVFKAVGLAMRQAVALRARNLGIPSVKGVL